MTAGVTIVAICFVLLGVSVLGLSPSQRRHARPLAPSPSCCGTIREGNGLSISRRQVHQQVLWTMTTTALLIGAPRPAAAGEVGARITKAVTTSDLGISVRRSVVEGAQIMDRIDGQWEQFSDKFGLGTNRARQADNKPPPKRIPQARPLDGTLAAQLLNLSDRTIVALAKISWNELDAQIDKVTSTVAPSYERSGLQVKDIDVKHPRNGDEFNFLAYTHFKAYIDLILLQPRIDFRSFQKEYEAQMGEQVAKMLIPSSGDSTLSQSTTTSLAGSLSDPKVRQTRWATAQDQLRQVSDVLVQKGLVAQIDTSYEKDDLADWLDDAISDLQFNVALDGDVTLTTQILLQEQGFRFYPNFARYAIRNVLQKALGTTAVDITEYYMDTDYNSDPDKFEVKEVLLSIVLEID